MTETQVLSTFLALTTAVETQQLHKWNHTSLRKAQLWAQHVKNLSISTTKFWQEAPDALLSQILSSCYCASHPLGHEFLLDVLELYQSEHVRCDHLASLLASKTQGVLMSKLQKQLQKHSQDIQHKEKLQIRSTTFVSFPCWTKDAFPLSPRQQRHVLAMVEHMRILDHKSVAAYYETLMKYCIKHVRCMEIVMAFVNLQQDNYPQVQQTWLDHFQKHPIWMMQVNPWLMAEAAGRSKELARVYLSTLVHATRRASVALQKRYGCCLMQGHELREEVEDQIERAPFAVQLTIIEMTESNELA